MKPITLQELESYAAHKAMNVQSLGWAQLNLQYLNKPMTLFGSSQKVEKGADKFDTRIMYLQPADKVARATLCAGANMAGCKAPCLISSGQLGMSTAQRAATKRTILWLLRPDWFTEQLLREIDKAERRAAKTGIPALFRLNGTSDINWIPVILARPDSMFYDYTKNTSYVRKSAAVANYHVTYSGSMYSLGSRRELAKAVKRGYNIAVAVNTKLIASDAPQLADTMATLADFDETDLRHLDKPATIGALKRKGSNKTERAMDNTLENNFFITRANVGAFKRILAGVAYYG